MNKKILVVSYYFPPIKAIGGIRTYNFIKYLNLKDWDTTVFTTSAYKILENESFFSKLKNTKYVYLPTIDIQVLRKIFKPKKASTNNININNKVSTTSFMQKVRNSFPFNISYEGGFIYILFGVLYGLYHVKKYNIKYIYSTFSPNSNHIVAYFIKLFIPSVYWVADFRDLPYGDSEAQLFMKKFQLKLNIIIYGKSNAIVTISDGLKNIISKYNKNTYVINNGIDLDIDKLLDEEKKTEYFNIVYTGSLYSGKRDAELLFKVIQKLIKNSNNKYIKLVYAGKDKEIWQFLANKYNLLEYTLVHDMLSTQEVKQLQSNASINLMLTWATENEKGILTGKFYEYLSYPKPIVCIINGEKDIEIEDKFNKLNCGIVVYEDEDILYKYVDKYFNEWQKNKYVNIEKNKEEFKKYSSKYLTDSLEKILLKVESNE